MSSFILGCVAYLWNDGIYVVIGRLFVRCKAYLLSRASFLSSFIWVLQDVYSFRALVFYGWISMLYERMLCMKCVRYLLWKGGIIKLIFRLCWIYQDHNKAQDVEHIQEML